MIKYAYMDLDSVAYIGAFIAEKTNYKWIHKESGEESEVFKKADEAKVWLQSRIDFGETTKEEWHRESIKVFQSESVAIKIVENELQSWLRTARNLTGNNDIIFRGYLTSSGRKTKDVEGLENRYQFNRYDCLKTWKPKEKPKHLKACREYLLNSYDWIKLSASGIEADAPVVCFSEKRGKSAVCMTKDKDLKQLMGSYYIDMNPDEEDRELKLSSEVGSLEVKEGTKGAKTVSGDGFKLLCLQTCVGDPSDGYKGISRYGAMTGYKLLDSCETVTECCEALVNLYSTRFKDGIEYESWDKKQMKLTWEELLIQHNLLAYHERGKKDTSCPMERYLNGEDPIYRYNK